MSLYLFKFKDPIPSNYKTALPNEFLIKGNTTYDILLIRLFTSTAIIVDRRNSRHIRLDRNYAAFPHHYLTRKSGKPIQAIIAPFSYKDYIKFSNKYYGRNLTFYYNILQEVTWYFVFANDHMHQAAFVNLYRCLEYLSYSFPLIHASHFQNFTGSFDALRSYFLDEKTSETKFFETFTSQLFRGTPYLNLTSTFDFSHPDIIIATSCFDSFHDLLKAREWTNVDRSNFILEVENKHLLRLFSSVRNRYFHFAIGGWQRNLHTSDLKDPDNFFKRINEQFLNWIGFIFSTVVKENMDNVLL